MNVLTSILRSLVMTGVLAGALAAAPSPSATAIWESADIEIVVRGTSTLHDWSVESRTAAGQLIIADEVAGSLSIPAKSLSGSQKGLNDRMYAALKADTYPTIRFEAAALILPPSFTGELPVRGRLTIAGTTRELTVTCRASEPTPGQRLLEADLALKMTDFGIKPPTFMGMVRTGDAVTVQVRWRLLPRAADATPAEPIARR